MSELAILLGAEVRELESRDRRTGKVDSTRNSSGKGGWHQYVTVLWDDGQHEEFTLEMATSLVKNRFWDVS